MTINIDFKSKWREILLIFVAIIFFVATSYLNYSTQYYSNSAKQPDYVKWASPDETANYVFTKYYAQTGRMSIYENYNNIASNVMHPRSVRSDNGELKPVSFLGIILIYGTIAKLTSYKVIPYLTPLIAAISIFFFYLGIKKLFTKNVAFLSAIILSVFPPFVYYTTRSMFHNVLFMSLLIISFYYGLLMIERYKSSNKWINIRATIYSLLSGFILGLAISVRASELMWLFPALFVLWLVNFKKIGFYKLIVFVVAMCFALLPMFNWNIQLYESPFYGGYPEMNKSISKIAEAPVSLAVATGEGQFSKYREIISSLKSSIFYFGFDYDQSVQMFKNYFIFMFPIIFYVGAFGFLFFISSKKNLKKKYFAYYLVYFVISLILVFYYGSWVFHDNPDTTRHTIGNSYTRYWLPVYLGFFPFISYFLLKIASLTLKILKRFSAKYVALFRYRWFKNVVFWIIPGVFSAFLIYNSLNFVIVGSEEGLHYQKNNQMKAIDDWKLVLNETEHNSAIITTYHDKLFFPERKVIVGDFSDLKMVEIYADTNKHLPVYYYGFKLPEDAIEYLNSRRLAEVGLMIEEKTITNNDFGLYKISAQSL